MRRNSLCFEVCIDAPVGFDACAGLVDRIELCSALELGGLTPDPGMIAVAQNCDIPCHAMIRPRAGDFCYSPAEVQVMIASIKAVKQMGLAGIVIGATRGDALDVDILQKLANAAQDLDITLHRAIDLVRDPLAAMEQAISLGFTRILTSGGQPKAEDGIATLAALQTASAGRIEIMAGSGISVSNLDKIAKITGITSFHTSCSTSEPVTDHLHRFGFAKTQKVTNRAMVATFRKTLDALSL